MNMNNSIRTHHLIRPGYITAHKKYFSKREVPYEKPYVVAYVEGRPDQDFWREVFNKYSPVEVTPTTNKGSADGKEAVLKYLGNTGKDIIICIDSDFNYLLPHCAKEANLINNHICVFHTYTYTVENYRCYARSLNELCKNISMFYLPRKEFNFEDFFNKFSGKIYEPFTYFLYFKSVSDENTMASINFEALLKFDKKKLDKANDIDALTTLLDEMLEDMEYNLIQKVINLEINVKEFNKLQYKIKNERDVKRSETYLFINGHILLEHITKHLVTQVVKIYSQEEKINIKKRYKDKSYQLEERLNEYTKLLKRLSIENSLKSNTEFHECYLIEKIKQDIDVFIDKYYHSVF